jgi:hypothetical protein
MRLRTINLFVTAILGVVLSACAVAPAAQDCPRGAGHPSLLVNLYFGRDIKGRSPLTEVEWNTFVDTVVTPAVPGGFTIFNADGAWMDPIQHQTMRDPTKVLQVALPDTPASMTAINRIRAAYQSRFHQQLVGLMTQRACAEF